MAIRHLLALCLLSLTLIACGDGDSDSADPTAVVNAYHQALMDGDADAILALTAGQPERSAVESTIEIRQPGLERGGLPDIISHTIDGDSAIVVCRFGPVEQEIHLRREDGTWRIAAGGR